MSVEMAMIERYRRRESSVEEPLIEMSLAGVSVQLSSSPIIKQARGTVSGSMLSRPRVPPKGSFADTDGTSGIP